MNARLVASVASIAAFGFLAAACQAPADSPSPSPSASPSISVAPSPSESAFNEELLNDRLTVLLVGTDVLDERGNADLPNTDALMLASVSADQSEVVLVSLPRDTVDVPLGDGETYRSKINALLLERGIEALVEAMEELYGVPIDGHVIIAMEDFPALVTAVNGVMVDPPEPLSDPPIRLDVAAGEQELDAQTALSYVRSRIDKDYGRMARQQEVIQDLVRRLTDPQTDIDLAELLAGLDSLETDLPLDDLPTLIEIARRAQSASVTELLVEPPLLITFEGDRGDGRGYVLEPDVEAIREAVTEAIGEEGS